MDPLATIATVMAVFVPALLLPGPDFVGVVRATAAGGRRAGLLAASGVAIGLGLYASLGLLGLSALLLRFEGLAWAVRVAGGVWLLWLGIALLRTPAPGSAPALGPAPDPALAPDTAPARPAGRSFLFGLSVTITNPKAIVLFASLFATAVGPATPLWAMLVLIGLVGLLALAWYALVACLLSSGPALASLARARRTIDRAAGGCFLLFGGKLLADSRTPLAP